MFWQDADGIRALKWTSDEEVLEHRGEPVSLSYRSLSPAPPAVEAIDVLPLRTLAKEIWGVADRLLTAIDLLNSFVVCVDFARTVTDEFRDAVAQDFPKLSGIKDLLIELAKCRLHGRPAVGLAIAPRWSSFKFATELNLILSTACMVLEELGLIKNSRIDSPPVWAEPLQISVCTEENPTVKFDVHVDENDLKDIKELSEYVERFVLQLIRECPGIYLSTINGNYVPASGPLSPIILAPKSSHPGVELGNPKTELPVFYVDNSDVHNPFFMFKNTKHPLSPDVAAFMNALVAADGEWVSGVLLRNSVPELMTGRIDRVRKRVPPDLKFLIKSYRGLGYCLRVPSGVE